MVNFLLKRPIAVSMSFLAILILGIVSITKLPVSLMPDIDIPKVSVHVAYPNHSAIELERTVAKPLRQQLMQVSHLTDIRSESQDGNCIINLDFEHGVEIDYIFIEVNEKIDRAINNLPRDIRRPKVMKASATDIPVFYLNLTLKDNKLNNDKGESNKELFPVTQDFVNLSNFSNQVIKKRIEQLKEVAMVDISGLVFPELLILPNLQKMESLNIQLSDIEGAIRSNNINLGNMLIRDGQYQYSIRFASTIRTIEDIGSIYLKVKDRLIQLKDVAQIIEHPANRSGLVTSNGKEAITMAVIKQADAQMRDLKKELDILLKQFRKDYPHIEFETSRNQTKLLDYSISNLGQSLLIGGLLAFFIMFLFLKDFKSPFLIGIAIPASIIISLLFFYIAGISLNIVSISGLILGVGMMIDNSIIVIDNITQNRERGRNLFQSCVIGANEVFRPLLSSVLTTCAVFIPLIFIQGISGALFFDQAMAITIGLFVSLAVSIMLVPVYYRLFYIKDQKFSSRFLSRINRINYDKLYERGFHITMRNQGWSWLIFVLMLALLFPLYGKLDKARLPQMAKEEILVYIDWNDRINLEENKSRVEHLTEMVKEIAEQFTCLIGNQQFLLDHSSSLTSSESVIYIMAGSDEKLSAVKNIIDEYFENNYPQSLYHFSDAGNIFDLIFSESLPPLLVKLRTTKDLEHTKNSELQNVLNKIYKSLPECPIDPIALDENIVVEISLEKLLAYNIAYETVIRKLKSAFSENEVLVLANNQNFTPVVIGGVTRLVDKVLGDLTVPNKDGQQIQMKSLLKQGKDYSLKTIVAGREGEYYPITINADEKNVDKYMRKINEVTNANGNFEASYAGSIFTNRKLIKDLAIILLISLLLLYFILASQFESLSLPLIVLLEVPIDIFGAFFTLWIFGESLNLMSIIGIIVMSGIIINDSILKIDTINQLRNSGYSLMRALEVAGQRRLKPILMTSLTTILALLPFLFISGLGADLQRPLALAVIGGMTLGTFVSLYFIPLLYYRLIK